VRRFAPDATACPPSAEEALGVLLGRPAPRRAPAACARSPSTCAMSSARRHQVSAAFRLSDLEAEDAAHRSGADDAGAAAGPAGTSDDNAQTTKWHRFARSRRATGGKAGAVMAVRER